MNRAYRRALALANAALEQRNPELSYQAMLNLEKVGATETEEYKAVCSICIEDQVRSWRDGEH